MRELSCFFLLLAINYSLCHSLVKREEPAATPAPPKRIVCYYANWSVYRPGNASFSPENIHPHLCTHIIYAFATLEREVGLVPFDPKQDLQLEGYKKFIDLKKLNPDLKLLLGVGGTKEGSIRFSKISGDPELRTLFVKNGVTFLRQFQFDGLDLVWQYPGFREGSTAADKENYVQLVKELKGEFEKNANESGMPELILSMVVPSLVALLDRGFDLEELNKYMSFMSIVTYDYHTSIEPFVNHVAPIYPLPGDELNREQNIDHTITAYLRRGADPRKLNLGIPLYGTSYKLADSKDTDIGSATEDEGDENEPGVLTFNQVCQRIKDGGWTVKHVNKTAMGPYAFKNNRWMSYDDLDSVRNKAKYAIEHKIGGLMFWSIDQDDFRGQCFGEPYPMIKAALEAFLSVRLDQVTRRPPPPKPRKAVGSTPSPAPPKSTGGGVGSKAPSKIQEKNSNDLDSDSDSFPILNDAQSFKSQRDLIFQNIKLWVTNYFYS